MNESAVADTYILQSTTYRELNRKITRGIFMSNGIKII